MKKKVHADADGWGRLGHVLNSQTFLWGWERNDGLVVLSCTDYVECNRSKEMWWTYTPMTHFTHYIKHSTLKYNTSWRTHVEPANNQLRPCKTSYHQKLVLAGSVSFLGSKPNEFLLFFSTDLPQNRPQRPISTAQLVPSKCSGYRSRFPPSLGTEDETESSEITSDFPTAAAGSHVQTSTYEETPFLQVFIHWHLYRSARQNSRCQWRFP